MFFCLHKLRSAWNKGSLQPYVRFKWNPLNWVSWKIRSLLVSGRLCQQNKWALGLWSSAGYMDMKLVWRENYFRISISKVLFSPIHSCLIPSRVPLSLPYWSSDCCLTLPFCGGYRIVQVVWHHFFKQCTFKGQWDPWNLGYIYENIVLPFNYCMSSPTYKDIDFWQLKICSFLL